MNCGLTHGSESELLITNPEDVPFKNDEYHLAKAVRAASESGTKHALVAIFK